MMTLALHPDLAGQVDQEALRFFLAQVRVEEVGMEVEAEWPEVWASWEVRGDQVVSSPDGGHHLAPPPMLDPTTS